jgi:hypothetical protein
MSTMPSLNFALHDVFGVLLAFLIFPSVILFPGYVIGWAVDLFEFRRRPILTRHAIAVLVSIAVVPILLYLLALFLSFDAVIFLVLCFFILYLWIMTTGRSNNGYQFPRINNHARLVFLVATGWVLVSILSLVDMQWGKNLYYNIVALDFATRATLVNAITRTGVPPVNPSYFAGYPVFISSLYYFWYILCSVVKQLGWGILDARMTLIAGDVWCGLALSALIAFYLSVRNNVIGESAWKTAFFGISLLAVSGLDFIPASIVMLGTRVSSGYMWPHGDLEHWNEQITAWVGSLFWAPHHVAAVIACMTGFLILQYYRSGPAAEKLPQFVLAGLAFASAIGLSTWVTLVFAVFLGVWSIVLLVWYKDKAAFLLLVLTGVAALMFAVPFLTEMLKGGTGGGIPVAFEVRRFRLAIPFLGGLSPLHQNLIYFLLLPLNYLLELGFFFIVAVLWLRQYRRVKIDSTPYFISEIILLCVVTLVCSVIRSTVVGTNDLGWRGWLLGQFILLVWATDLNRWMLFLPDVRGFIRQNLAPKQTGIKKWIALTLVIGVATTVLDVALLRFWPALVDFNVAGFPNTLSPDPRLGARTFDSRLAYEFINNELPKDVVIQQNPISDVDRIDRPSGLYANRQFAISYNAPFNIPLPLLKERSKQISEIFLLDHQNSWDAIDMLCKQYFIDILIVSEQDPLWKGIPLLEQQRTVLYQNRYYAVLPCGEIVLRVDQILANTP